jgi:DMSO reductase anchor subunit
MDIYLGSQRRKDFAAVSEFRSWDWMSVRNGSLSNEGHISLIEFIIAGMSWLGLFGDYDELLLLA